MKVIHAHYEDGILRPAERLDLRSGEQVSLFRVRRPDPRRWDLPRIANTANADNADLVEQGLAEWASDLDAMERT